MSSYWDSNGNLVDGRQEVVTKVALPTDLQFHALTDASALPMKCIAKSINIANAVSIRDTTSKYYDLITSGALTEDEIRRYKNFKVSVSHSHDAAATIQVYTSIRAFHPTTASGSGLLYTESSNLVAANGRLLIQEKAGGVGASPTIKAVPALSGVHSNLIVAVTYTTAPTAGTLTVTIEMN